MKKRKLIRFVVYVVATLLAYIGSFYFDHSWYVPLMFLITIVLVTYLHGWRNAFGLSKEDEDKKE